MIDMTSQTWRTPAEVDRTVWKHWLTIVKPDKVDGHDRLPVHYRRVDQRQGAGDGRARSSSRSRSRRTRWWRNCGACRTSRCSSPTRPSTRNEDGIIAYTWMKYMTTGDETWPLRLPMTKAAVRAMDTITALMATPRARRREGGEVRGRRAGRSAGGPRGPRRRWTSGWSAIVPASIDLLNLREVLRASLEGLRLLGAAR